MDNSDIYKEYIQDSVITPLERMMGVSEQMKHAIDDDDQLGTWASEQDLIISEEEREIVMKG